MRDGEEHPGARGAVELGDREPGHPHRLREAPRLDEPVLSGGGVQHEQGFVRRGRVQLPEHPPHLRQLLHEPGLGVQASRGIGDQHVRRPRGGRLQGVEDDRSRIRPRLLGDHRNAVSFPPTP